VGLVGGEKSADHFGVGDFDRHYGVGEDEAVVADHDGAVDLFGDPVGLDHGVQDLLVVPAVDLDPACVPLGDGVLLVVEDRPGGADTAVHAAKDDGEARARRPVELLVHVEEAVGRGCGEDAGADGGGGDADRHDRVLALHPDVFGLQLALLDPLRDDFGDRGRGGDRIG